MRDRRNTNLSVCSTDSTTSSASSASSRGHKNSLNEKALSSSLSTIQSTIPAPSTTKSKPRSVSRRIMAAKVLLSLCTTLVLWNYILGAYIWPNKVLLPVSDQVDADVDADMELVSGDLLPDEPTVLMLPGTFGTTSKWTIAIPHNHSFPLANLHYQHMCSHGAGLRSTITGTSRYTGSRHWWQRYGSYQADPTFLDISAAEQAGLLPQPPQAKLPEKSNICSSSLTFVLESSEASLGKTLLFLWLSYGLARASNRAFFLDDTRWAWGKYTAYFAPPPPPACSRPPPHYIVSCPLNAKHLVVSAATAPWTFDEVFDEEHAMARPRSRWSGFTTSPPPPPKVYEFLRAGYEDLFKLNAEDAAYAEARIAELRGEAVASSPSASDDQGSATVHAPLIGMQIRRGDRHPFEVQYSRDYLPLSRYAERAKGMLETFASTSSSPSAGSPPSIILLATDDPNLISSPDLTEASSPHALRPAQTRILLATKAALDRFAPVADLRTPGSAYVKHVDENSGWEGGFYRALFEGLEGVPDANPSSSTPADADAPPALRTLLGRAWLLDLAVLERTDGVVCAVSAASCRLLGVMMGWEAVRSETVRLGTVESRRGRRWWENVDKGRVGWSWDGLD